VESGFRSIAYNRCIGGATVSQHLYGYAADIRMPGISAPRERVIAKRSQIYGLSCYSSLGHNHLDLRLENRSLPELHSWWWPSRRHGHDLSDDGSRCWGE
ncbi:MAG: zinc D-Ala-D-Ala carboxypeptidase, partial [Actinomycetota bacterium]|nr:zinc D-Ala-D-Ala carboxypeptidase [Actinomycetota bacterium]